MKLRTLCFGNELKWEIETCVAGVMRTAVEASRFMNLLVLQLLEKKQDVPKLDQSLMYGAFMAMAGALKPSKTNRFDGALFSYDRLRQRNIERFDYRHVSQMLNYAGREYMTACQNEVVLNISMRVRKAFKSFFDALPQDFGAEDRNKACQYFMRRLTRESCLEEEISMWDSFESHPIKETREAVVSYVDAALQYDDLSLDRVGLQSTKIIEKNWWRCLRWLHDLQDAFELHGAKSFTITPRCSFAARHVTTDSEVLRGFLMCIAERTGSTKPVALTEFRRYQRDHLDMSFKISRAGGKYVRRKFDDTMKSDRYSVSVIVNKVKSVVTSGEISTHCIALDGK